jgi:hypothetical protein
VKFSIILNSRKRVPYLKELFGSLAMTTVLPWMPPEDVEVLVSVDHDDTETQEYMKWMSDKGSGIYKVRYEVIPRSLHLNNRLTSLARQATGKYILILNDDTEIQTYLWDANAWDVLEQYPDGIVYGYTDCNSADKEGSAEYASFPIVSKKSVDILGYFMHPAFTSLGGDVHLWRIYNELGRVVDTGIQIRHTLHETVAQVLNPDQTAAEMRNQVMGNWWGQDISEDVEKLRKCLN